MKPIDVLISSFFNNNNNIIIIIIIIIIINYLTPTPRSSKWCILSAVAWFLFKKFPAHIL